MKAIVIIDEFPKSCYECPLTHSETGFFGDICDSVCTVLDRTNIVFMDGMGKPDWCPLRPLPEKYEEAEGDNDYIYEDNLRMASYLTGVINGRNSVIDEIVGETE